MVTIPFEKHTLSNGLDVILHEDHTIPLVAVNVWYHVGSKDEEMDPVIVLPSKTRTYGLRSGPHTRFLLSLKA